MAGLKLEYLFFYFHFAINLPTFEAGIISLPFTILCWQVENKFKIIMKYLILLVLILTSFITASAQRNFLKINKLSGQIWLGEAFSAGLDDHKGV